MDILQFSIIILTFSDYSSSDDDSTDKFICLFGLYLVYLWVIDYLLVIADDLLIRLSILFNE